MFASKSLRPSPRAEVMAIDAYVPGKSGVAGARQGPQAVVERIAARPVAARGRGVPRRRAISLAVYPDGASRALREAIGRRYGLDAERIICGNGSDELLALLAHVFLRPGDEGLYSEYGFLVYPIAIRAAGGDPGRRARRRATPPTSTRCSPRSTPRTKIVYLANPNNPTGTYLPFSEVKRLHAGLPGDVLLVLDAAYAEYVGRNDYAAGHRTGRDERERRDDAHVLENLRPGESAHRLGLRAGADRRRAQPRARAVQRQRRGAGGAASRRSATPPMSRRRSRITRAGCRG